MRPFALQPAAALSLLWYIIVFFSPGFIFSYLSTGQEIGWKERLRYDVYCVEWDLNSVNQSLLPLHRQLSHARTSARRSVPANTISTPLRAKAGIPRQRLPRSILVTSSPTHPTHATSSRGCREDATKITASVECKLNAVGSNYVVTD